MQDETLDGLDNLYGGCRALIDGAIAAWSQISNVLDTATDAASAVASLYNTIPLLKYVIPAGDLFEACAEALSAGIDIIDANVADPDTQNIAVCELFCRARENGNSIDANIVNDLTNWLNSYPQLPDPLEAAGMLGLGTAMLFEGANTMVGRALTGLNNPDRDWQLLCTDCAEISWCHTIRFDGPAQPSELSLLAGEWIANNGLRSDSASSSDKIIPVLSFAVSGVSVSRVTWEFSPSLTNSGSFVSYTNVAVSNPFIAFSGPLLGGAHLVTTIESPLQFDGPATVDELAFQIDRAYGTTRLNYGGWITSVEICGSGTNPFA